MKERIYPLSDMIRNTPSPEGYELGEQLARFADDAEPRVRLKYPAFPVRCKSCAFRRGSKPNGMVATLMNALKCWLEKDTEFHCHEHGREGTPCAGWAMLMLDGDADPVETPWDYVEGADKKSEARNPNYPVKEVLPEHVSSGKGLSEDHST